MGSLYGAIRDDEKKAAYDKLTEKEKKLIEMDDIYFFGDVVEEVVLNQIMGRNKAAQNTIRRAYIARYDAGYSARKEN